MQVEQIQIEPELRSKFESLLDHLKSMGGAVIAFSGGVDSTFLAKAAYIALGEKAIAITARLPSYPKAELEEAIRLAKLIGIRHMVIDTDEVYDPNYAANPPNRCYFCKTNLFSKLRPIADELGVRYILYGAIADDLNDFRQGYRQPKNKGQSLPLLNWASLKRKFANFLFGSVCPLGTNLHLLALPLVSLTAHKSLPKSCNKLKKRKISCASRASKPFVSDTMILSPELKFRLKIFIVSLTLNFALPLSSVFVKSVFCSSPLT